MIDLEVVDNLDLRIGLEVDNLEVNTGTGVDLDLEVGTLEVDTLGVFYRQFCALQQQA